MSNKFKVKEPYTKNAIKPGKVAYYALTPIFSFAKYIETKDYFSPEDANQDRHSLFDFFRNIREFSKITWGEMRTNPKIYHFHSFEENISILAGFNDRDLEQFKIPGLKQGRFIGFFDGAVFNILVYDANHKGNPRK